MLFWSRGLILAPRCSALFLQTTISGCTPQYPDSPSSFSLSWHLLHSFYNRGCLHPSLIILSVASFLTFTIDLIFILFHPFSYCLSIYSDMNITQAYAITAGGIFLIFILANCRPHMAQFIKNVSLHVQTPYLSTSHQPPPVLGPMDPSRRPHSANIRHSKRLLS